MRSFFGMVLPCRILLCPIDGKTGFDGQKTTQTVK
jgi:hypothetical protein